MANHTTSAQRRNARMDKIFDQAKELNAMREGRWRQVQIKPDFCRWYYTGREYDSRQCVNFKRMKASF